jgi:hypothetical protein
MVQSTSAVPFGTLGVPSPMNPLAANSTSHPPVAQFDKTVKRLWDDVIGLCVRMSQDLNNLPGGFEVDLELRWVPAHLLNAGMRFHAQADTLAGNARRSRQHLHSVGRLRMPFAPSVIRLIKDFPMIAESSPDSPSEELVFMDKGVMIAARRAADEREEKKLEAQALKQTVTDGSEARAAWAKTTAALAETEAAHARRAAAMEEKYRDSVALQLFREQNDCHKVALARGRMDLALRGMDLACRQADVESKRMFVLAGVRGALMPNG